MSNNNTAPTILIILGALFVAGLIPLGCWAVPQYNVYEQRQAGEAEYQKAESNRKIAILEAEAKLQAASSLAKAEIERAKGVAEANKIIGDSLKNNDAYLRYLWINELKDPNQTVIYVPTEANLPILEASRGH